MPREATPAQIVGAVAVTPIATPEVFAMLRAAQAPAMMGEPEKDLDVARRIAFIFARVARALKVPKAKKKIRRKSKD